MELINLQNFKNEITNNAATDGKSEGSVTKTFSAIAEITKDFGDKVAVDYTPTLQVFNGIKGADWLNTGAPLKSAVVDKQTVLSWIINHAEIFGELPAGTITSLRARNDVDNSEIYDYLVACSQKGRAINKELKIAEKQV